MKLLVLVLVLAWTSNAEGASIRGRAKLSPVASTDQVDLHTKDLHDARKLHMDDFVPLSCNANISTAACVPWSSYVQSTAERVIIECGDCVEMDFGGPTLILDDGIDIRGKLMFPDNDFQMTIVSPLVAVQGELEINCTKAVNGAANVKFLMVGENDQYFTPVDSNSMACGMNQPCKVGKKAIVVAGGKLDIHGLPPETPTWVNLYDVASVSDSSSISSDDYETYVPPPVDCGDGNLIQEDFTSIELGSSFGATLGSNFAFTGNSLKVYNRTAAFHGPQVDLKGVRHCLEPERVYLMTARVRLLKDGVESGTPTKCSSSGEGCLIAMFEYMRENESRSAPQKWAEKQSFQHQYGVSFTIAQEVIFSGTELQSSHIYESFRFYGPGAGVDIELEEFQLRLPPPEAYADASSVCQHLVPGNGNAEIAGLSPFPFYSNSYYTNIVVSNDSERAENHYFEVIGRKYAYFTDNAEDSDWDMAGLTWDIPALCIKKESLINFQADIRVHPNEEHAGPFVVKVYMRANRDNASDSYEVIATCPPSDGTTWVSCAGAFTVHPDFVEGPVKKYDVRFKTDETGVNYDLDNLVLDVDSPPRAIIVDSSVKEKWAPGAEILVTSHTRDWDAHQLRRIVQVSEHGEDHTLIELDSSFRRPTTLKDSHDFAVEVALLSRNIVFEGGEDDNQYHGGHFWVMHTPQVAQHIEGIEVRNFGQQGSLGRYPIHFHFCGDVEGSVLTRNTIRQSNQRCVVVHGTDNLMVSENVAYDTKGHCFILEDGMETGNRFIRNLGAQTGRVDTRIPNMPDKANGDETDENPSTFWVTNPSNIWIGNVAAGSIFSGFWFELQLRGERKDSYQHLDPKKATLSLFKDNVAHSNKDKGLRTYPSGYVPDDRAVFDGFKSYRNDNTGIFFHNSRNLAIVGGLFADNKIGGIDIDRSAKVVVNDTTIVGESSLYKQLMGTQDEEEVCSSNNQVFGIELHTFVRNSEDNGARINNVTFSNYAGTACNESFAFRLDDEIRWGTFDWFTALSKIYLESDMDIINFCPANDVGVVDAYFTDLDGSLGPSNSTGPATLVSNNDNMLAFVDAGRDCQEVSDHCYMYCESTCFRSVRYAVDPTGTQNLKLKVCQKTDSSNCVFLPGFFFEEEDPLDNTKSSKHRIFVAHLPTGTYDAVLVDEGGSEVWPSFVEETYEDSLCPTAFEDGAVTLKKPVLEPQDQTCVELIRNGDAEVSPDEPTFWLHRSGGVKLAGGSGIDNSNALADVERDRSDDAVAQFLDTRCTSLMKGRFYEITAWVKLVTPGGNLYTCDPSTEKCPEVGIRVPGWGREPIAETTPEFSPEAFQLVHGIFQINDEVAVADRVEFYIERNRDDLNMFVDNVSMKLLPMHAPTDTVCSGNLVYNGDFSTGDARFWDRHNSDDTLIDVGPAAGSPDYALSMKDGYARPWLRPGCTSKGERYEVSVSYKLLDTDGQGFACDVASRTSSRCPRARLVSVEQDVWLETKDVAWNIGTPSDTDWNHLFGVFRATNKNVQADSLRLYFSDLISDFSLIVDNVQVQHVPQDCSNLIIHSDMERGYGGLWTKSGSGVLSNVEGHNSPTAIRYGGRTKNWNGPRYEDSRFMDYRCLTTGSTWEVDAQIKVVDSTTGQGAMCDLESSSSGVSCPQVRIEIRSGSVLIFNQRIKAYEGAWNANEFNRFKAEFTLTPMSNNWNGTVTDISLSVRDFPAKLDVIVDDFVVSPVNA